MKASKLTLRQVKAIDIRGKEWRDKTYGNSYHSVRVVINPGLSNCEVLHVPFNYGYGDSYRYSGLRALQARFPRLKDKELWQIQDEFKKVVTWNIDRGCLKRDVVAWGKEY